MTPPPAGPDAGLRVAIQCRPLALGAGGMERTATKLANHLVEAGHQAALIYVRGKTAPIYPIDPRVVQLALPSRGLEHVDHAQAAVEFGADVVLHLYPDASAVPYIRAMAEADIPVVLHEATNPARLLGLGWAERLRIPPARAAAQREALAAIAAQVRVTLPGYRDSFPARVRDRIVAFPNAFPAPPPECRGLHDDPDRPRRFIQIGGLKANKNLLPALRAFLLIADRLPGWRFAVFSATAAGNGVSAQIDALLADSPHADRVDLFPATAEIDREYAASDIHLIPSLSEGLPNCVAEAMRHGVPSIGFSSCPGTNALIVDGQNGLLVAHDGTAGSDGSAGFAAAMLRLAQDDTLRSTLGAQAEADSGIFDPDAINAHWDRLLQTAARSPGYRRRLAAADPLLLDDGPDSLGRMLVAGLGFAALPAALRHRSDGEPVLIAAEAEAIPVGDAVLAEARRQRADAVAWVELAGTPVPAPVVSGFSDAPKWAAPARIVQVLIQGPFLEGLDLPAAPAHPEDGSTLAALGRAGAVLWVGVSAAPRSAAPRDLDWHLAAAAMASAHLQEAGATAALRRASDWRARRIAALDRKPDFAPLGPEGMENWRRWYRTDPDLVHRIRADLPDLTLRAWLAGNGAGHLVAAPDWLLGPQAPLLEALRPSPFEQLFLWRRKRLAAAVAKAGGAQAAPPPPPAQAPLSRGPEASGPPSRRRRWLLALQKPLQRLLQTRR